VCNTLSLHDALPISAIKCYYTVFAERKDMEKLIVEYEGTKIKDYPGQDWLKVKEII
jgi:hypothetical protein